MTLTKNVANKRELIPNYVKGEILWGWPAGRPKFTRMSDSEAQGDLAKMK